MTSSAADQALFEPEGANWVPTDAARGPWDAGALHGGPVAALLTREMEALDTPVPMRLARVTVELLRPVPLVPLVIRADVVRPGAKVGLLAATLHRADDDRPLAMARALRIRTAEVEFPDGTGSEGGSEGGSPEAVPELPEALSPEQAASVIGPSPSGGDYAAYHNTAVEHRFLRGEFGRPGPAFDWIRLVVPIVAGEEPTGWQRAAAIADFANGLSATVPFDGTAVFINPDLSVHLWREPKGEWIGMDSVTRTSETGIGMSDTAMWDRSGRIGRTAQSLLLDRP